MRASQASQMAPRTNPAAWPFIGTASISAALLVEGLRPGVKNA